MAVSMNYREPSAVAHVLSPIRYLCAKLPIAKRATAHRQVMFKREEASRLRHEFWTTFGKYMGPVLSLEGARVNWINYHTGIKDVYFRMDANQHSARIAITLEHTHAGVRELYYEQLLELREYLHTILQEEWQWQQNISLTNDKIISSAYHELPNVSVFNKDQWPDLISFFKPRIIALDEFWENARYSFDGLA